MATAAVGIVTTVGCPYCKKAKNALVEQGVVYAEADLGGARDILAKVKETTGQKTVPQIFIGGDFIGGASELLTIIGEGKLKSRIANVHGRDAFPKQIRDLVEAHRGSEPEFKQSEDPKVREMRETLEQGVTRTVREVEGRQVRCASAADFAAALTAAGHEPGVALRTLLAARAIAPASRSLAEATPDPASLTAFYVLTSDARAEPVKLGEPLNTHIVWYGPARAAVDVSGGLRARILALYDAHLSADGRAVDYEGLARDPQFGGYRDATAELQRVDLAAMSREERIAFFINIYNALIVHGTVSHGVPASTLARLKFFGKVCYDLGGARFTADDIEHGVLRGNAASPASLGSLLGIRALQRRQIPDGDGRAALAVTPPDPRIHFALVCGARSCPPIKLYTPDNLDEGLTDAGSAFCDGEVDVDPASGTVTMSKIFKWYGADFAKDDRDRLRAIAAFCSGVKSADLRQLADASKAPKLKYKPYDWTVNAK